MTDIVEKVARAHYGATHWSPLAPMWEELDAGRKSYLLAAMRTALREMRGAGKLVASAMHEKAGKVGWESEYECECFDAVLDAALRETG